ncbi:Sterile alpha motif domain [Dillenia turbinata]|uniref:Sterile alpha motif domain n=1 Tax=Dillenia turbinata TaxID=194707 RepID=A0AAN8VF95_9MAGN
MAGPEVTITLGRAGQVVRKNRAISDSARTNHRQLSGSKRSIKERLGNNVDELRIKRQRGNADNGGAGIRVGKNDLRLKLMRKNLVNQKQRDAEERGRVGTSAMQSRTIRTPVSASVAHGISEQRGRVVRRIPLTKSADDLLYMEALRKSHSSPRMDGLMRRSPDRILRTYRDFSPPRRANEMQQLPLSRPIEVSRSGHIFSDDVAYRRRPDPTATRVKASLEAAKATMRIPTRSGMVQKNSYMGEEPLTVAGLLHSLGLGKYVILFQAEEIDMAALRQMGDQDLKELGIPMGPRKKILLALLSRSKRAPP